MIDYPKSFAAQAKLLSCYRDAFGRVMQSGIFLDGPENQRLEEEWAEYLGIPYKSVVTVSSGTTALELVLRHHAHTMVDTDAYKVIVQSYAPSAVGCAIRNVGFCPHFVDIDTSYQIDLGQVEQLLQEEPCRVAAVVIIHMFGMEAPVRELGLLREKYGRDFLIVEDCSHAHGLLVGNHMAGTLSGTAVWSFYPTKNLPALGDAGAIFSAYSYQMIRDMAQYGWNGRRSSEVPGGNYRCDELQAAFLREGLNLLSSWNMIRKTIAQRYMKELDPNFFHFPEYGDNCVFHQFPVRLANLYQEEFLEMAPARKIYIPLHQQPLFRRMMCEDLPVTRALYDQSVFLPIHQGLLPFVGTIIEELNKDANECMVRSGRSGVRR